MTDRVHPDIEALADLLEGREPAAGDADLVQHVETCPDCRARQAELREATEALSQGPSADAPETWVRRAEQRAVPRSYLQPLAGRHMAQIVFDSAQERVAGIRASSLEEHQWYFTTEQVEIELTLSADSEVAPFGLSGQLLPLEGASVALAGCRIVLEQAGATIGETISEETGEFMFRERPEGPFHVLVRGAGWEIRLPELSP